MQTSCAMKTNFVQLCVRPKFCFVVYINSYSVCVVVKTWFVCNKLRSVLQILVPFSCVIADRKPGSSAWLTTICMYTLKDVSKASSSLLKATKAPR